MIPTFGTAPAGVVVVPRPGAYAVVPGDDGRLAAVRTGEGLFLLGGAIDGEESAEQAVVREAREECGLVLAPVPGGRLGEAHEIVHARDEGTWYEKRGVFMVAHIVATGAGPGEPDHALVRLEPATLAAGLAHASHRWAVERWIARAIGIGAGAGPGI